MGLILTWAVLLSSIILVYIVLDGFDLGIGILFPWIANKTHRDIAMSTVTPVWDGNGTYLVLGAATLYAAFPKAYGILLPAFYTPIMILVISLVFRGVAFEFRFKAERSQTVWDTAFALSSTIASFIQGAILGRFVQGFGNTIPQNAYAYNWLTPFSCLTGIAVVFAYALLGANWLIIKTADKLQENMFRAAQWLLGIVSGMLAIVSLWTLFLESSILERWLVYKHLLWVIPTLTIFVIGFQFYCLHRRYERLPFFLSIAVFVYSYVGFGTSLWPYVIPHSLTFWEAAAPASSLKFALVGTIIVYPVLLIYTAYAYYVFRGKVTKTLHY